MTEFLEHIYEVYRPFEFFETLKDNIETFKKLKL